MTNQILVLIVPILIVVPIFALLIWLDRRGRTKAEVEMLMDLSRRQKEHEKLARLFNKNRLLKALLEYAVTRHKIILQAHPQGKEVSENDWGFTPEKNVVLVPEKILKEYNRPNGKIKVGVPEMFFATEIGHIEHHKTGKLITACPNARKRKGGKSLDFYCLDCYYNELTAAAVAGDLMEQLTKDTEVGLETYLNAEKIAKHQCSHCFAPISQGKCPKKQDIERIEKELKNFFKN